MTYEISALREDPDFSTFSAQAVGGYIGAEIAGLDISKPLDPETISELQQALVHYHVIFFREQNLTPAQHAKFAQIFGKVQMGGTIPRHDEVPEVKVQEYTQQAQVSGDVNMHADDTFKEIPSRCSALYGVDMPPAGGDTIWVNTEAAYAALSEPMQTLIDGLTAVHDLSSTFGFNKWGLPDHDMRKKIHEHYPPVIHPVVRVHPVSGRKSIFVNEMVTTKIIGLEADEGALILDYLIKHLKKAIFQCRLHWDHTGTMVVWDNRSTQHLILPDFQPQYRKNHRVAIEDDARPVGPADALKSGP